MLSGIGDGVYEKFTPEHAGGNNFLLKSFTGYYLSCVQGGIVRDLIRSTVYGNDQIWTVEIRNNYVNLKSLS